MPRILKAYKYIFTVSITWSLKDDSHLSCYCRDLPEWNHTFSVSELVVSEVLSCILGKHCTTEPYVFSAVTNPRWTPSHTAVLPPWIPQGDPFPHTIIFDSVCKCLGCYWHAISTYIVNTQSSPPVFLSGSLLCFLYSNFLGHETNLTHYPTVHWWQTDCVLHTRHTHGNEQYWTSPLLHGLKQVGSCVLFSCVIYDLGDVITGAWINFNFSLVRERQSLRQC